MTIKVSEGIKLFNVLDKLEVISSEMKVNYHFVYVLLRNKTRLKKQMEESLNIQKRLLVDFTLTLDSIKKEYEELKNKTINEADENRKEDLKLSLEKNDKENFKNFYISKENEFFASNKMWLEHLETDIEIDFYKTNWDKLQEETIVYFIQKHKEDFETIEKYIITE